MLNRLIFPEKKTCAIKSRTIIEKVNREAALIKLDQFKTFDKVDHHFLEADVSAADFKVYFHFWIHLMYANPEPWWK